MSVKTLYEYSCDCCGGREVVGIENSRIPDGFVGLMWANASLVLTENARSCAMHLCHNCHEELGDLYKREMATKEENEG